MTHGTGSCRLQARMIKRCLRLIDESELDRAENDDQQNGQRDDCLDDGRTALASRVRVSARRIAGDSRAAPNARRYASCAGMRRARLRRAMRAFHASDFPDAIGLEEAPSSSLASVQMRKAVNFWASRREMNLKRFELTALEAPVQTCHDPPGQPSDTTPSPDAHCSRTHPPRYRGPFVSEASAPTRRAERIGMLDTTRGIAVLGILLMNIVGFGLPEAYEDPTNWGGHAGADLAAWRITSLFFEGTMRGLFTLLFGAGALLFLQRHAAREPGPTSPAKLYYRRTALLIVFGLINAYLLLWEGDILFYYGVVGLFLYFFRNLSTPKLLMIGVAVLSVPTIMNVLQWQEYHDVYARAASVQSLQNTGTLLSPDQQYAIEELRQMNENHKPSVDRLEYAIDRVTSSYKSAFHYLRHRTFYWETSFFVQYGFAECLGMMLIGMALLKLGVLSGDVSRRTYWQMAIAGYAIGLAINVWEMLRLERSDFSVAAIMDAYLTYDAGRVPLTFGHVGLIGLLWLSPIWMHAKQMLASVGQMALTNYLAQSVICSLLFTGAGLGWFGQLQRHELYYVVAAIWILQLAWSPWWLRRYQFGPVEWLWRTLTYGTRQPMRIEPAPIRTPADSPERTPL